jgi:hypothetical protein
MEESLRVMTDDDETPEKTKRKEQAFMEIKLDVDPFCLAKMQQIISLS